MATIKKDCAVRDSKRIKLLLGLVVHPYFSIEDKFLQEVRKRKDAGFNFLRNTVFALWFFIWILTIFLNDPGKPNYVAWLKYRLTIVFGICLLWLLTNINKDLKKVSPVLLSLLVTGGYSWATRLGAPVQPEMIILFPLLILGACYASFIVNALLVLLIAGITMPLWGLVIVKAWVFTYFELGLIPLIGAAAIHRSIVVNNEAKVRTELLEFQQKQTEIRYQELVESFLPQALKAEYSRMRLDGLGVEEALLKVISTREVLAVAVFVDWVGSTKKSQNETFRKLKLRPRNSALASIANRLAGFTSVAGDGVMAVFPLSPEKPDPSRFLKFVSEALSLQMFRNQEGIEMPLAASLGSADMGNVGSSDFRSIAFSGEAPNLAARLESASRRIFSDLGYDPKKVVLVSENLAQLIRQQYQESVVLEELELEKIGQKIRDFEEMKSVWILKVT